VSIDFSLFLKMRPLLDSGGEYGISPEPGDKI
jgi:hypothetical protein